MYRFRAKSRATTSSTAIFLSQQSRQYFSSPRGSETSLALQSAQRTCATDLRDMGRLYYLLADLLARPHGRGVHVVDVFLHHAARAEAGGDADDGVADERQPPLGDAVLAVVERRHDLGLEEIVDARRIGGVLRLGITGVAGVDQPAVVAGIALGPPAVADRQVRHAVERRLHAAGAARLHRLARVVQPHVAALDQEMRDVQVVVVDEGDAAAEGGIDRAAVDLL